MFDLVMLSRCLHKVSYQLLTLAISSEMRYENRPLNPPILGDFRILLPQNWGLGGYSQPEPTSITWIDLSRSVNFQQPSLNHLHRHQISFLLG
jgi:hypothetical protein